MKKILPEKDHFNRERTILRVFSAFVKLGTVISLLTLAFAFREGSVMLLSYIFLWIAVYHPLSVRFQRKCVMLNIEMTLKQRFPDICYIKKPNVSPEVIDKCGILPVIKKKSLVSRAQLKWKTDEYSWTSCDINYFTDKTADYPIDAFSGTLIQVRLNRPSDYNFVLKRKLSSQIKGSTKLAALSEIFSIQGNLNDKLPSDIEQALLKLVGQTGEYIGFSIGGDEVFIALANDYFKSSYKLSKPITDETFSVPPIPRLKELEEIVCTLL